MEEGLPEEDSDQSAEGTLLHKYSADPTLDRKKLTRNQRDLLEINHRLVKETFERADQQFGIAEFTSVGGVEQTMWLHRGIKALYPGHADLMDYTPEKKVLLVDDFKFGFKVVTPAAANLQLRPYAVMGAEIYDCDAIVVGITQPRLSAKERLTIAVYNREDIEASRQQLYDIWDATKKPDAPLNPSEEACRYCKAKMICEAYQATIDNALALVPVPPAGTVAAKQAAVARSLMERTPDELAELDRGVKFAGFLHDPLYDEMRRRITAGQLPDYKLGKESEVREVTDVPAAMAALTGAGIPADKLRSALNIKLGEVENVYRNAHETMTWSEAKDAVNNLLGPLITRHHKKPSVERAKNA